MKKLLVSILGVFALSACSSTPKVAEMEPYCPPPAARQVTLNEAQYKPYDGKGTAEIRGRFCIDIKGEKKCLADQVVFINPVTDYSNEWYARMWVKGEVLEQAHPIARKHNIMVKTDKNGYFVFKDLKPGTYYVAAASCPCSGKVDGENINVPFQRWATKVKMQRLVTAKMVKVFGE